MKKREIAMIVEDKNNEPFKIIAQKIKPHISIIVRNLPRGDLQKEEKVVSFIKNILNKYRVKKIIICIDSECYNYNLRLKINNILRRLRKTFKKQVIHYIIIQCAFESWIYEIITNKTAPQVNSAKLKNEIRKLKRRYDIKVVREIIENMNISMLRQINHSFDDFVKAVRDP